MKLRFWKHECPTDCAYCAPLDAYNVAVETRKSVISEYGVMMRRMERIHRLSKSTDNPYTVLRSIENLSY